MILGIIRASGPIESKTIMIFGLEENLFKIFSSIIASSTLLFKTTILHLKSLEVACAQIQRENEN